MKWDILGKLNSKYFIYSDEGKDISEKDFRLSGKKDADLVLKDSLLPKSGVLVEIGCGIGRITEFLIPHYTVKAFDVASEMIRQARARLRGAHFEATDGKTIPLKNNSVDAVFSFIVFQHMNRDTVLANMREIERVLKPNGVAKIQVRGQKTRRFRWYSGAHFTAQDLSELAGGLEVIKTEGEGKKYYWIWFKKS